MIADDLQVLLELHRVSRLSDVARRLDLDETTVSRRVSRLEKDLGVRLVDREREGWRLNDAGQRLIPYAETVETARVEAEAAVASRQGEISGTVRVVAPDGFGAYVLIPGMAALRHRFPRIDLEVVTATTHSAAMQRDFDLAVSLERPEPRAATVRHLANYQLKLYASPGYLDARGTPAELADLLHGHSLIWYVDSALDVQPLRMVLGVHLPQMKATIQTNNISGQLMAARSGLGIAPLPTYMGDDDDQLVCVLPDRVAVNRTYWILIPDTTARLRRTRAVVAAIYDMVAAHPEAFFSES